MSSNNNVTEQTINIQQGATFNMSGLITDNASPTPNPIDLTGYNFQGFIARFSGDTPVPFNFTIGNQSTNPGTFTVTMPASVTLGLQVNSYRAPMRPTTPYIGQFEILYPDGVTVYRFFEFAVNVDPVVGQ